MELSLRTGKLNVNAYFIGLTLMAASLTLSPFMMSISQFFLLFVLLTDDMPFSSIATRKGFAAKINAVFAFMGNNLQKKWNLFIHNRVAVVLVSLYLLHLLGLIYTSDFQYAFKDLRVKLPLLIFPFVMSSMKPLDRVQVKALLTVYVLATFVGTLFSFGTFLQHNYTDIREISLFISHIRFSLSIVFSVFILCYSLITEAFKWGRSLAVLLLIAWFIVQLFILESLTGIFIFIAMIAVSLMYYFFKCKIRLGLKIGLVVLIFLVPFSAAVYVYHVLNPMLNVEKVDLGKLEKKTNAGNDYWHDTIYNGVEDGKYIGLYYCRKELRESWTLRSQLPFDGLTLNGEPLETTLARYLTSKGLHKDSDGIATLTDEDIHNIENGIANYNNWKHQSRLRSRLSVVAFEYVKYKRSNNPNGGSISQRFEYTRASLYLIGKHMLFGVGTGDIPQAYRDAYNDLNSPLKEVFRNRAHNQYLSITVGFGLVGLIWFLFVLIYPYFSQKKKRTYLYTIFLSIILLSMLPEDTIESQAGVSLYAFFNAFFLFAFPIDKEENDVPNTITK